MSGSTLDGWSAPVSWWSACRERWLWLRNRCVASAAFRTRAAAFPLTRMMARRDASQLFDLLAGFVYSQVLAACVRLQLFDLLAQGPQTPRMLSQALGLPDEPTRRLLDAARSLALLERLGDGRYALGRLGAAMVGNAALHAMVEHHATLYADLADPVALLQAGEGSGRLARFWPYAAVGASKDQAPQSVEPEFGPCEPSAEPAACAHAYSALMAATQPLVAEEILGAYPLSAHRHLLDVGGGNGTFVMAAATRAPHLRLTLFDLAPVAALATQEFARAGLADRAMAIGGNFLQNPLPRGADVATLIRVIHDHDDESARVILAAVKSALPPGGCLLLAEPLAETPGAARMGDAYFGFYLMAMGRGRPRTALRLSQMLREAGFGKVRALRSNLPLQTSVLLAHVPRQATTDRVHSY